MDYALVTVRNTKWNWQTDMELPAKMRINELAPKILDVLRNFDESRFQSIAVIELYSGEKKLDMNATLADYQLWDGSIIDIRW